MQLLNFSVEAFDTLLKTRCCTEHIIQFLCCNEEKAEAEAEAKAAIAAGVVAAEEGEAVSRCLINREETPRKMQAEDIERYRKRICTSCSITGMREAWCSFECCNTMNAGCIKHLETLCQIYRPEVCDSLLALAMQTLSLV